MSSSSRRLLTAGALLPTLAALAFWLADGRALQRAAAAMAARSDGPGDPSSLSRGMPPGHVASPGPSRQDVLAVMNDYRTRDGLEPLKLAHQPVVVGVADLRGIQDVVAVVVVANLVSELADAFFRGVQVHERSPRRASAQ